MRTIVSARTRPWWRTWGVLLGVLFILGGLACFAHALLVPAGKHDVTHGECADGPCTTYSAPWAWALGGGVLLVMGIGWTGYARYSYVRQNDETSSA